jgi:hypothetical protein
LFPLGLFRIIFPPDWNPGPQGGVTLLVGAWIVYLLLTIFGLSQSRRLRYFCIYAVLCGLLALNVVGCQVMMHDPWKM